MIRSLIGTAFWGVVLIKRASRLLEGYVYSGLSVNDRVLIRDGAYLRPGFIRQNMVSATSFPICCGQAALQSKQ